jgi:hypothetical protein
MPKSSNKLTTDQLGRLIYEIRSERVMLDSDLTPNLVSTISTESEARIRRARRAGQRRFGLTPNGENAHIAH